MLVTVWVSQEVSAAREAGWRGEEERSQEGSRGQRVRKEYTPHCAPKRVANSRFGLCMTQQGATDPLLEQSGSGLLHLRGSSVSCHPDSLPVSLHPLGSMAVALPWVAGSTWGHHGSGTAIAWWPPPQLGHLWSCHLGLVSSASLPSPTSGTLAWGQGRPHFPVCFDTLAVDRSDFSEGKSQALEDAFLRHEAGLLCFEKKSWPHPESPSSQQRWAGI